MQNQVSAIIRILVISDTLHFTVLKQRCWRLKLFDRQFSYYNVLRVLRLSGHYHQIGEFAKPEHNFLKKQI